jgi:MSHA pilin protein MshD
MFMPAKFLKKVPKGVTLIELVAGIVIFGISLSIVTGLIANASRQSIDPIWQVRATELGQSLMNEISAKAFDENSDFLGGATRCNEGGTSCTTSSALGPDNNGGVVETRSQFDDVDDYNGLIASDAGILNSLGEQLTSPQGNLYQGFTARVAVFYDDNLDGIDDDDLDQNGALDTGTLIGSRKLVQITIQTPGGDIIPLSFTKTNF